MHACVFTVQIVQLCILYTYSFNTTQQTSIPCILLGRYRLQYYMYPRSPAHTHMHAHMHTCIIQSGWCYACIHMLHACTLLNIFISLMKAWVSLSSPEISSTSGSTSTKNTSRADSMTPTYTRGRGNITRLIIFSLKKWTLAVLIIVHAHAVYMQVSYSQVKIIIAPAFLFEGNGHLAVLIVDTVYMHISYS